MVHTDTGERKKFKPRGRPFAKGNKNGKLENGVLVDNGHLGSNEREFIDNMKQKNNAEHIKKEVMEPKEEEKIEEAKNNVIEEIDFQNGQNKLTIRFSEVFNRRFRVQVFLNGDMEIRPVTYQGSSSGHAFWKLLKGALKK